MISRNWTTNGHTGAVEPFVFRKACTNDLIVSHDKSFRHAHIHLMAYELTRRMAEAVSEGFRVARSILDGFLTAREEPIPDPVEAIRKIAEARKFSQKLTDEVVSTGSGAAVKAVVLFCSSNKKHTIYRFA